MRDNLKDNFFFEELLKRNIKLNEFTKNMLSEGNVAPNKIESANFSIFSRRLSSLIGMYSLGLPISNIRDEMIEISNHIRNEWKQGYGKIIAKQEDDGQVFSHDQYYLWHYEKMLDLISLAYLLKIPDENFENIVSVIDRDNIQDHLFEFIISSRFPDRKKNIVESYDLEHSIILKVYDKLRRAINSNDVEEASQLIEKFLKQDFYHKNMGRYNSHKGKSHTYCGYWSFESAVVVKIKGLDESIFGIKKYFPKDIIH